MSTHTHSIDSPSTQTTDFAGEVRPVLAQQRDGDLRTDPGDNGRHGGARDLQCAHIFSLQGEFYENL